LSEIERNEKRRVAEEERKRQLFGVMEKLQPANSDMDQLKNSDRWKNNPTSGRWLLNNEFVIDWANMNGGTCDFLWLKGLPGAGK